MNKLLIGLKTPLFLSIALILGMAFLPTAYAAEAADMPWDSVLETLIGEVTVSGGSFSIDTTGGELTHTLPMIVLTASIAITGMLLMFGESSGMARTTLNIIFCTSMVLLIGSWFNSNFFSVTAPSGSTGSVTPPTINANHENGQPSDFLSTMTLYYISVCHSGAVSLFPTAFKLLLMLAVLDFTWSAMFKANEVGPKFILQKMIKYGIFMWLLAHWTEGLALAAKVFTSFEKMGLLAAPGNAVQAQPDAIWSNGLKIIDASWESVAKLSLTNLGGILAALTILIVTVFAVIVTALALFMCRIEFWTIATIGTCLIPFGVWDKSRFLFEKTLGAVLNLGVKMAVISFVASIVEPTLTALADPLTEGRTTGGPLDLAAGAEVMFGGIVLAAMVMKLPELVSGLLNGSPSLGGGDLFEPVKSTAGAAAAVKTGGISQIAKMKIAKDMAGGSGVAAVLGQRLRNAAATTGPRAAYRRQTMDAQERAAER
ncbi:MAG: type IV secretion system protein, partial [Sporomusaceae bacterium]|nr:type IV secretion system protein [Sporomusaceae bacterium]